MAALVVSAALWLLFCSPVRADAAPAALSAPEAAGYCDFPSGNWIDGAVPRVWQPALPCKWRVESFTSFVRCMANATIIVIGDSMMRYSTWWFVAMLERCPGETWPYHTSSKLSPAPVGYLSGCDNYRFCGGIHGDCSYVYQGRGHNITIHFIWMPFIEELTGHPLFWPLFTNVTDDTFVLMSVGLWTVKHEKSDTNITAGSLVNPATAAFIETLTTRTAFADPRRRKQLLWRSLSAVEAGDRYSPPGFDATFIRERNHYLDDMWRKAGFTVQNVERYTYHPLGINGPTLTWDGIHNIVEVMAVILREAWSYVCLVRRSNDRGAGNGRSGAAAAAASSTDAATLKASLVAANAALSQLQLQAAAMAESCAHTAETRSAAAAAAREEADAALNQADAIRKQAAAHATCKPQAAAATTAARLAGRSATPSRSGVRTRVRDEQTQNDMSSMDAMLSARTVTAFVFIACAASALLFCLRFR